ncbi:hypothetical protein PUS82_00320 [Cytobacillus firmus]|uniref:hypothetical protein n=1 Tax=Cytobacillus firmus TaxID=1399 RepID=UPI00237BEC7A|nr:hypothetical protein [Cytobacillus firmus]MDD9309775.1 hypothetical protein [Cytobacillus firmus]
MYKKIGAVALTSVLTFGGLGVSNFEKSPFGTLSVEATLPEGESLKVSKVVSKELGVKVAGLVGLEDKQYGGTVVFKIKPSESSQWNGRELLELEYSTLTNFETRVEPQHGYLEKDGERYVRAYIYLSDPSKAKELYLYTSTGEYGNDPFEYEAVFVPGKDLTAKQPPKVQSKKVYWEGAELKKGQIGKIEVSKKINLWKREGKKLKFVRVLHPGESYRVYSYDSKFGGQYGLGGGYYITNMDDHISYKTPSKSKIKELNNQLGG